MRIRMLTTAAGPEGVRLVGQVVAVADDEANALIEGGYAEAVETPPRPSAPETTAFEPRKNAAMPRPTKRKK